MSRRVGKRIGSAPSFSPQFSRWNSIYHARKLKKQYQKGKGEFILSAEKVEVEVESSNNHQEYFVCGLDHIRI